MDKQAVSVFINNLIEHEIQKLQQLISEDNNSIIDYQQLIESCEKSIKLYQDRIIDLNKDYDVLNKE